MLYGRLLVFAILFFHSFNYIPKDKTIFISPLNIPLQFSSNFGELRKDHFHSGLDIKTQGVTGKEVVATANGYVYRISVSPAGFGKALYVKHSTGYSTVYGHLESFSPAIEEYVKTRQYENKSYLVTLYPSKDEFPVRQGEVIAWSGNSGSSGGPHLHYEIRKSDNEVPVNPLLFEFGSGDNIDPVIERLAIYPESKTTLINKANIIRRINVTGGHGTYYVPSETPITISGPAGFSIKSYDLLNDSYNKCAVYSIELSIDSILLFKYKMDGFSFEESRYVNSHIDYEAYQKEKTFYEKTFVMPNDKLSVYKDVVNRGIFNFKDNNIHHAIITVTDIHKNKSTLSFRIKSETGKKTQSVKQPITSDKNIEIMPYGKSNRFAATGIDVSIPAGALYDTLNFDYNKEPGQPGMLSDLHQVHNIYTPLHKAYTLSIKPTNIPAGKDSKMLIVMIGNDQKRYPVNSKWSDGYLTGDLLSFGKFCIGIDTIPPEITSNGLIKSADLTGKKVMNFRITDDFSGIKSYEPVIDGKWALFEYDQKNNLISYRFDEKRITRGAKHNLVLKVSDNRDNISYYRADFTW
jgi:hypothetical protein